MFIVKANKQSDSIIKTYYVYLHFYYLVVIIGRLCNKVEKILSYNQFFRFDAFIRFNGN